MIKDVSIRLSENNVFVRVQQQQEYVQELSENNVFVRVTFYKDSSVTESIWPIEMLQRDNCRLHINASGKVTLNENC